MRYVWACFLIVFQVGFCDIGDDFVAKGKGPNELETLEYLKLVKPFVPKKPRILEAGAHGGNDTVIMGKFWPKGQIYAFEPVDKFFTSMLHELEKHHVRNVTTVKKGLFTHNETRTFYYSQHCGGASSFLPEKPDYYYDDTAITVECVNLDSWAEQNGVDYVDFMWLDMEGAEYYALSAAPKILSTTRVILMELNFREFREGTTQYSTIKKFLNESGFTLYRIWGSARHQGTGMFVRNDLLP